VPAAPQELLLWQDPQAPTAAAHPAYQVRQHLLLMVLLVVVLMGVLMQEVGQRNPG
jgi:hypothetical protein